MGFGLKPMFPSLLDSCIRLGAAIEQWPIFWVWSIFWVWPIFWVPTRATLQLYSVRFGFAF